MDLRKGSQTPTKSFVIPYGNTYGEEAVQIYNKTKRTCQEWQALLLKDMLAVNDDGLWTHTKFGYSLPRRNGKNEVVTMRELYGLKNGEHILHTAHRTPTSHAAWERLCELLSQTGMEEGKDYKTLKQFGLEEIRMVNGDGRCNFRTRSSKGGLGEGYDLLIIDEAQEYTDDQESALKYVVTDSMNPQTVFCGTPPTPISSGTVFTKFRKNTLAGNGKNSAWEEWSIEKQVDPHDKESWYLTNPSLGTVFTERSVEDEIGTDDIDFNIQRLGLWIKYNQHSAISRKEWEALKLDKKPQINKKLYVGIKFGVDGTNVALSVAVKTKQGQIFLESIDCQNIRNGYQWIIDFLVKTQAQRVVIDGAGGQKLLADELKEYKVKGIILPTVKEVILANSAFEQALFAKDICHMAQPSLVQSASNVEKRNIGSNGGFGYRSIKDGVEVALLDSAILAFWICAEGKEKKKQRINY